MKFLPFERRYALEFEPCSRCAGSGRFASPSPRHSPDCLNCRGLGRKLTRSARQLFNEIAELLGVPVIVRESRIQPKHLDQILGSQVRAGMQVAPIDPPRPRATFRIVAHVTPMMFDQSRLTFTDGTRLSVSATTSLLRQLTSDELGIVSALLATRLGRGATDRRRALLSPTRREWPLAGD